MDGIAPIRRMSVTNVLVVLLVVGIALGAFLLLRSFGAPASAVDVSELTGTPCPVGGEPACFQTSITNAGTIPSTVRCDVTPGPGNTAVFTSSGATSTDAGPLDPDATLPLVLAVDTTPGNVRIYLPKVTCSPI
jgi:hypothetical protein